MSNNLQTLKAQMQQHKLADAEVANKSIWKALLGLIGLDDDDCGSCADGCSPGCQPGCQPGCLSGGQN